MNQFTSIPVVSIVRHIADSTVRRLSLYLGFLEEKEREKEATISSDGLASLVGVAGITSAQVRKDLSFFGSFGKRGLGYPVPELAASLREILGLTREWKVCIIGAGKIGVALAQYKGFRERGFKVAAVFDSSAEKIGKAVDSLIVKDLGDLERENKTIGFDIAVLAIPAEAAQQVADRVTKAGIKAILNFAPAQLNVPQDVIVREVNMAMELEGLSFALTNREE